MEVSIAQYSLPSLLARPAWAVFDPGVGRQVSTCVARYPCDARRAASGDHQWVRRGGADGRADEPSPKHPIKDVLAFEARLNGAER